MTIKDVAKVAGVSIATVSHVVNKTRYVKPDLVKRVEMVIESLEEKPRFVQRRLNQEAECRVLCVVDEFEDRLSQQIVDSVLKAAEAQNVHVNVVNGAPLLMVREVANAMKSSGMIRVTTKNTRDLPKNEQITTNDILVVRGDQSVCENEDVVIVNYFHQTYLATKHLVKLGHENLCLLNDSSDKFLEEVRQQAFKEVLAENKISFSSTAILGINPEEGIRTATFHTVFDTLNPTAFLCASNEIAMAFLKYIRRSTIQCPEDVSVLSLEEFPLYDLLRPSLTTVAHNGKALGEIAFHKLYRKLFPKAPEADFLSAISQMNVIARESTRSLACGPSGEKVQNASVVSITESEEEELKKSNYTVVLSFHFSGMAMIWSSIHEKAIKEMFEAYGITILAVMNAQFDPEIQIRQLESICAMKPDLLISTPTDEAKTASSYKRIVENGTQLLFINNVPQGFSKNEYVTCVGVNERENGRIAGRALGEYMANNHKHKAGFIIHGANFFPTRQRDMVAQQVLREEFDSIDIVDVQKFQTEENTYQVTRDMLERHPEIDGLYVTWDVPAFEAMRALTELGREDVCIVSADLDLPVASVIARGGMIKAVSAQRLYKQGCVVAQAAGMALLGKKLPKYIGINPRKITQDNLLENWNDLLGTSPPDELVELYKTQKL